MAASIADISFLSHKQRYYHCKKIDLKSKTVKIKQEKSSSISDLKNCKVFPCFKP